MMNNEKQKRRPQLVMSIDFGGSLTKIVGSKLGDDKCTPIWMEPYCCEIDDRQLQLNSTFDEHSCWVKFGGKYYAVGRMAKTEFSTRLVVNPPKIETMVQKTCAAISILAQRFKTKEFNLDLNFVLPKAEAFYRDDFIEDLEAAFLDLETPQGKITPFLKSAKCYPEGSGVYKWHQQQCGSNAKICVLMLGFRNASICIGQNDKIHKYNTCELGFYNVITEISQSIGGYAIDDAIQPILNYTLDRDGKYLNPVDRDKKYLQPLLKSAPHSKYLESELSGLQRQIDISYDKYLSSLKTWIGEHITPGNSRAILAGGTSNVIGKRLHEFLESFATLSDDSTTHLCYDIGLSAYPEELTSTGMAARFADIYVLWQELNRVKVSR